MSNQPESEQVADLQREYTETLLRERRERGECPAFTWMGDEHWGRWGVFCERTEAHPIEGEHWSARDACEPVARLVWEGTA